MQPSWLMVISHFFFTYIWIQSLIPLLFFPLSCLTHHASCSVAYCLELIWTFQSLIWHAVRVIWLVYSASLWLSQISICSLTFDHLSEHLIICALSICNLIHLITRITAILLNNMCCPLPSPLHHLLTMMFLQGYPTSILDDNHKAQGTYQDWSWIHSMLYPSMTHALRTGGVFPVYKMGWKFGGFELSQKSPYDHVHVHLVMLDEESPLW
jgi:hypothetical protein